MRRENPAAPDPHEHTGRGTGRCLARLGVPGSPRPETEPGQLSYGQRARRLSGRYGLVSRRAVLAVGAVNGGSGNVRIWQAAPLSQETVAALYQTQFTKNEEVVWDSREQAVAARKRVSFGAFIIEETPLRNGDASLADRMAQAVLSGIRELGMSCLPWTEELYQWRLRVELLRAVDKGGDWPTFRKKRS